MYPERCICRCTPLTPKEGSHLEHRTQPRLILPSPSTSSQQLLEDEQGSRSEQIRQDLGLWREILLCDFYREGANLAVDDSRHRTKHLRAGEVLNYVIRAGTRSYDQLAALTLFAARASPEDQLVKRVILGSCLHCAADLARTPSKNWTKLFGKTMAEKRFVNLIVLTQD